MRLARFAGLGTAYGLSFVVSALVGLLAIPVVISYAGPTEWGGLAVAQTVGSLAAIVVAFGWGVVGPTNVAGMADSLRGIYFLESLQSRMLLLVLVVLPYAATVWVVSPDGTNRIANVIAGTPFLIAALGGQWFLVGVREPIRLLTMVTLPRALGTVAGAVALALTQDLVVFASMQFVGATVATVLSVSYIMGRNPTPSRRWSFRPAVARLRSNAHGLVTALSSAAYVHVPLIIVSILVPSGIPAYALADKIQKFTNLALIPLVQVAQGFIPASNDDTQRLARVRQALAGAVVVAVFTGIAFAVFVPLLASFVSSGEVAVGRGLSVPFAIIVASIIISGVTSLACLLALGEARSVAISTLLGLAIGLPLCIFLGRLYGIEGAAWSVAGTEIAVTLFQIGRLRRVIHATEVRP